MFFQLSIFTCIVLFLSGSPVPTFASAFSPEKDCLWLSAKDGERKPDGSVILPLTINFGRFPAGNGNPALLSGLKVHYALASGKNWRSGEVKPEPARNGAMTVRIRVGDEQRLVLQVTAASREQGRTIRHSAVTCYQRFGRIKHGSTASHYSGNLTDGPLEILIKPPFNYWRQTGEPFGITCRNRFTGVPCPVVTVLDEHLPPEKVILDTTGFTAYTSPDDAVLNSLEERSGKETLLVAESDDCRATLALALHRNRTSHHKPFPGLLTLSGACVLSVLTVLLKRRKTE